MPVGGIIYLLMTWLSKALNPKRRKYICPLCGKPYEGQKLSAKEELTGDWEGLKNIAKDKNFQSAVISSSKNIRKSIRDFNDSLDAPPIGRR